MRELDLEKQTISSGQNYSVILFIFTVQIKSLIQDKQHL